MFRSWLTIFRCIHECMDIGARPHVCGGFFLFFYVWLNSHRWFMLCLVYTCISYLVLGLVSRDRD
jgi:hypothetical protein